MVQKWISILFLCVVSISPGLMQEATDSPTSPESIPSGLITYDLTTGTLATINPEGIHTIAEMPEVLEFIKEDANPSLFLSLDYSKFVFATKVSDTRRQLYVADVGTGVCCTLLYIRETYLQPLTGKFSPDGTQFAALYGSSEPPTHSEVVVFDVNTGRIVGRFDSRRLMDYRTAKVRNAAVVFRFWDKSGITMSIFCQECDPDAPQQSQTWNPADDSLSEGFTAYKFEQWLPSGERIRDVLDPSFPSNPPAADTDVRTEGNVLLYTSGTDDSAEPSVIYFNPDHIGIPFYQYYWIANGQAIFIQHSPRNLTPARPADVTVLLRDGTQIPVSMRESSYFLYPVSDGWVTTNIDRQYFYYRLVGTRIEESVLEGFTRSRMTVLPAYSVDAAPFPEVTAP